MDGDAAARTGEFADWNGYEGDFFEDLAGPFFWRREDDGAIRCAFRAEAKHMNGGGRMHGGCLMTFADMALFAIARDQLAGSWGLTVALDNQFLDAARVGDLVEAEGEVTRAGRSLIFVRGMITTASRPLLTFSGVIKKLRPA